MATIKSFTDLEQSKKLAEILPIESADSHYDYVLPGLNKLKHVPSIGNPAESLEWFNKGYTVFGKSPVTLDEYCIPCWSLAALLDVLNKAALLDVLNKTAIDEDALVNLSSYKTVEWDLGISNSDLELITESNPIDACYKMILKLHELNKTFH